MRQEKASNKPKSVFVKNLTRKMTFYYLVIFFSVMVLMAVIIIPTFYNNSISNCNEYTSLISDQYLQLLNIASADLNGLTTSQQTESLLKKYSSNPSQSNGALIEQYLQSYASNYERIKAAVIETADGTLFRSFKNSEADIISIIQSNSAYHKLLEGTYNIYYSEIQSEEIWTYDNTRSIFISMANSINNQRYVFTIFYDVTEYLETCDKICSENFNSYTVLFRDMSTCVYSSYTNTAYTIISRHTNQLKGSSGHFATLSGIYFYHKISMNSWTTVTHIGWLKMMSQPLITFALIILVFLLSPILYYFVLVPNTVASLRPLQDLTEAMSNYSAGDVLDISINTGDELEDLGNTLALMSGKIYSQIQDIQQREREKCITQYTLLATQIDPHFIYNTLNVVNILARNNQTSEVIEVNTALSKILRERLNTKISIFETIENELETIGQFSIIMRYRYTEHVVMNINVEPELLDEKIPKNLLLPIVENSYYHGLTDETGIIDGTIDINIYALDGVIVLEISDDGYGMSEERLNTLRSHAFQIPDYDSRTHVGLTNIYDRLRYVYGKRFTIDIQSQLSFGTTVSITVPYYDPGLEFIG